MAGAKQLVVLGLDVDEEWHKSCMEEDPEAWNSMTGRVTQPAEHLTDVETSSESDDAKPVAQDSDVEPSDSGNDSDRDVVMEKVWGLSFSTCLQPTDPQYTAMALCVAPAEGQHPLDFMLDHSCEALTFTTKFPFGVGTFTDERNVPITVKKYFVQRLLNWDKRFTSDASYLFFAQYICEMNQIRDSITVAMRKTAGRMSASVVLDAEQLRQVMKNDNANQFLQNVRGSPAYFQRAERELIAIVAQLGCPQFFLTLSSADMSWPGLFRIIGQQSGRSMTDDDIAALSYDEKLSMLRNDPVLATRHF